EFHGSDFITEEEEKQLLAEDEEDLDVIDCYTEDFDSDMERDFCRKEAEKLRNAGRPGKAKKCGISKIQSSNMIAERSLKESAGARQDSRDGAMYEEKAEPFHNTASSLPLIKYPSLTTVMVEEDVDDDVIQINDDNIELLLEDELVNGESKVDRPEISLRAKDEKERDRILKEPLVKQIIIPEISISDEDDEDKDELGSQESLSLQIDHAIERASELVGNKSTSKRLHLLDQHDDNDSDEAEMGIKIGFGPDSSGSCMESFHQEDADFQQLKLEFYENVGVMGYEPEEELSKCHKTDEEDDGSLLPKAMIRIKEEPTTPVKERLYRLNIPAEDIPTIDLTSSDEEAVEKCNTDKKGDEKQKEPRKRGRKKKSEYIMVEPLSSEDTMVETAVSDRSIGSRNRKDSDAASMLSVDDSVLSIGYSDRVISLRKRKVTVLPEATLTICSKKRKPADMKKEPTKIKKRDNPAMRGYKRRKPGRSASKLSMVSVSTASSSLLDEDIFGTDTVEEVLTPDPSEALIANGSKMDGSVENDSEVSNPDKDTEKEQSKEELLDTTLKDAIAKELETEISVADSSMTTHELQPDNVVDLPVATTDIALEDMLESYFANEEEQKNTNPALYTISSDEKLLMDSLFADYEKQTLQGANQDTVAVLSSIVADGKPLVEQQNSTLDNDQVTINYTISDGINPPTVVPVHFAADQQSVDIQTNKQRGPHFKIIQNYDRYKKLLQARSNKQTKTIEPIPRSKPGRKRADSDEEYRPKSYMKKRLFARPRKRTPAPVKSSCFSPTGEYIENDAVDATQTFKNMPSLEEDLALTSSENSSMENAPKESQSKDSICEKNGDGNQKQLAGKENVQQTISNEKVTGKAVVVGKVAPKQPGKRGRPRLNGLTICDFFCTSSGKKKAICTSSCCHSDTQKDSGSQQSLTENGAKVTKKVTKKRKKKLIVSSSDEETMSLNGLVSSSTEEEGEPASTLKQAIDDNVEDADNTTQTDLKMNKVQVIISPLTDEKIRKINTPKKKKLNALTKACQTEISGLTWSVELDQIDFHSEYFEKLRVLLNTGASRNVLRRVFNDLPKQASKPPSRTQSDFSEVELPNRATLQLSISSPASEIPSDRAVCQARSTVEELLFQRDMDEIEVPTKNPNDQQAREQLEQTVKNVRSTFRIPKLAKQPSTSPQPVTSSTQSILETYGSKDDEPRVTQLPTSSRNISRVEAIGRSVMKDSGSNRPDDHDYVDDETESYRSSNASVQSHDREDPRLNVLMLERFEATACVRSNSSSSLASPLSFANAVNSNYVPPARNENDKRSAPPQPSVNILQVPLPLEIRTGLPDRAEMMNVKRTIRNDMTQQSSAVLVQPPAASQITQPQLPCSLQSIQLPLGRPPQMQVADEYKFNPPPLPGFHTFGTFAPYGGNGNAFNRGYSVSNELDVKPSISGSYSGWNNFGRNDMMGVGGAHPAGINDFMAMLYDQFKQQQIPQVAAGPSHPPMFAQWFPQSGIAPAAAPSKPTGHPNDTVEMISYLFGCYDFLTDRCIKVNCRYSHVLPREEELLQKLSIQNCEFIMATYRLVASRDDLFVKYFPVYANVMGRNKMRHQLVGTIQDCEKPKRPLQYYRHIVEGLKFSGTSPVQAVQIVLEKHKKTNFHQINVLVELIVDTADGVATFLRWLEDFMNVRGYQYEIPAVNRLVDICIAYEQAPRELAKFVSKLVLKVATGEEHLINTAALLEFVKKVRQDADMILDVEEIVKKYGKVVMRS
ncbi:uncharacterized protein LOC131680758, partial [Topomyia yanbarensis]|uniref:uncharacterized protein LOC131680758 n=1 Tax=Topomyia yanbarensis TaxID=2498891 RepID=UPI00273CB1AF